MSIEKGGIFTTCVLGNKKNIINMNIFGKTQLSIVNLAMLSYPKTASTLDEKLKLLQNKGFTKIENIQ